MDTTDYASYQSLFSQYGMNTTSMQEIISRWQEPHRFYHTEAHLQSLITGIEALFESHRITPQQKDVLLMTAFFMMPYMIQWHRIMKSSLQHCSAGWLHHHPIQI
jgi:predicted metal-dependent HD superfamily phosphohydrolase